MKKIFFSVFLCLLTIMAHAKSVEFEFMDTDGKKHTLSQYKGKWVVVNYWATWCPPCLKEIPDFSDFHLEHDDAVVIGVNFEPGLEDKKLKKFVDVHLISYPITRFSEDILKALGTPSGLPTTVIINPKGQIVKKILGEINSEHLNKIIAQLSKKTPKVHNKQVYSK